MEEHDYSEALSTVNTLQDQVSDLVRSILNALRDGRVSLGEGAQLSVKGALLATNIIATLQGLTPELRKDILHVLEHGDITLGSV